MQLVEVFRYPPVEGDLSPYSEGGDSWGFLYGHCCLASTQETEAWAAEQAPSDARPQGLLLSSVPAYNPGTTEGFRFLAHRGFWAVSRLGHDGAYYTLSYNSRPWGKWTGVQLCRHDLAAARAGASKVAAE
jgi:hypothetical protein